MTHCSLCDVYGDRDAATFLIRLETAAIEFLAWSSFGRGACSPVQSSNRQSQALRNRYVDECVVVYETEL